MRGSETVKVYRAASSGDVLDGPSTRTFDHDITNCIVLPRTSTEESKGEIVIEGWNVYAPGASDCLATDQVEVRGKRYDVEGVPGDYRSARGKPKLTLIVLKRLGS